jgi:hypothetical protein
VGGQICFDIDGDDFYIDLLFFHVEQLRYGVELKTGKSQPEYAGKLGFDVALVDDKLKCDAHARTVGILICGSRLPAALDDALDNEGSESAPL